MKIILDTHVLLWWLRDDPKLGPRARSLIAHPENEVLTSIASIWEVSIKHRVGKLSESGSDVAEILSAEQIALLPISTDHIKALEALPRHHGDPFDHLILAQARSEGAKLMTADKNMTLYGISCVGVR